MSKEEKIMLIKLLLKMTPLEKQEIEVSVNAAIRRKIVKIGLTDEEIEEIVSKIDEF